MPQTFIYAIAFVVCETVRFFFPQVSRIVDVLSVVCLLGIVLFGIGEVYLDVKKHASPRPKSQHPHNVSSPDARP